MIDNLIYDQTKNELKRSSILKVINFLILREFFKIFQNFLDFSQLHTRLCVCACIISGLSIY